MKPFLTIAGWFFTVFYLYQASLNLPEYFSPKSVMPCVTRILDSYIVWFIFPMSFIMAGIVFADIRALKQGINTGTSRRYIRARIVFGSAAVAATSIAAVRIISAC
jgi:hypothetical protein